MSTAAPAVVAESPDAADSKKWFIALAVALGALLEVVDTSIVNVALNEMQASLGATLSQVSWVVSGYAVANVIILPLTAWLGDRFGKKSYFIFSLIAFTFASILCGAATTLPMLIFARVLQGLGGGGLLAKAQSILFETFPKSEQAMAQGFFGAVVIAGPAIGPTLGGYLVTEYGWRWIFYINVPFAIAAVFMCATFLPADDKSKKGKGGIDWTAIALLAIGLGSLQTVLEEGQSEEWFDSPFIRTFGAAALIGLCLFVWRELKSKAPVVDLRVLRYRSLWAGSILSVVVGMALYGALFAVPIFAQSVLQFTSQQTGMLLLPGAIASAFTMPIAAKLLGKFDARAVLVAGAMILVFALVELHSLSPQTSGADFFWPLMIRSVGTVLMFLPLNMATLGPIPKKDVSAAAGFFNLTRQLGGSMGVAILTFMLERREAFHRAVLVEKIPVTSADALARVAAMTQMFVSRGVDSVLAHARALKLLGASVDLQAAVMSFNDTFFATAVLVIGSLPLVLLLGRSDPAKKVEVGH